jgi:RNA polymerase sigma-70 factor, ECF subfamily
MNRAGFENLIRQLSRKMYGFAFRFLHNQEEAEDAVQEIFIKLWNLRDRLDDYKSIEALATTMVKNYCIDIIRKQKNMVSSDLSPVDKGDFSSVSPQEQMENTESGEILNRIISSLPDMYGMILKMRDIEGDSFEEISEKTGQNINTVRVTLSRARKMIREEYIRYDYERRGIEKTSV